MKERSPRPSLVLVIVVLLIMAAPGSLPVAWSQSSESLNNKIQSQKQQLKKIESEIKQHRAKSRELVREEANVLNQLSHVDKEISLAQKYLGGLHEREKLLGEQIDSLKASVSYEGAMLVYQRHRLGERVRQMYKRGPNYRMEIILGSSNLQEALRRSKFLGLMAERDANLIEEVRERKSSLEQEQAMLTETMADIAALRGEREAESQKLAKSKTERVAMLKRIRNEKSKHGQAIAQLEASQEKMKDLIGELEQKRLTQRDTGDLPTGDFAALKGRLIRPVDGKITKSFGQDRHPKFGTVTFNNGVNIKAAAGTPIRAVAAARVEFVDWIAGYGNCIILNHGGGYYTLYAHAADIFVSPAQSVNAREVIAEVGDSGSLNGYECHFEIRKSKQPLNPADWFAK